MGPSGRITHVIGYIGYIEYIGLLGTGFMQVFYLGRAPRTKETLPDFLKWRRVTRPPLVFRGLTGSQRTPGFGASQNIEHNEEVLRLNLDLLEEKREQVLKRMEDYHRKTARYYDQRVKPRSYKTGDLVLKKLLPARKDPAHGKLGPNWEGPTSYLA